MISTQPLKKNSLYRRAQRIRPISKRDSCGCCGSKHRLQRHHMDENIANNLWANLFVICQPCHIALHVKLGNWGRMKQA